MTTAARYCKRACTLVCDSPRKLIAASEVRSSTLRRQSCCKASVAAGLVAEGLNTLPGAIQSAIPSTQIRGGNVFHAHRAADASSSHSGLIDRTCCPAASALFTNTAAYWIANAVKLHLVPRAMQQLCSIHQPLVLSSCRIIRRPPGLDALPQLQAPCRASTLMVT